MDFAKLKKSSSVEKLTKAMESQNKSFKDERYWEPTVDKAGNGFATIRFLDAPGVDGEDGLAFVKLFTHGFQGPTGAWYIENSRTTIGEEDPVSNYNTQLWNSGVEDNKKKATNQKRKLNYISNILVVKDPACPANEGKTFLFKYGKKIFDKIKDKAGIADEAAPDAIVDPDEVKFNPFNFWEGANFKLKIRKVEGYRNYDKSEFESQSAIFGGDDKKIEDMWKKLYSLKAEVAPDKFKSFDELQKKLNTVLGLNGASAPAPKNRTAEKASLPEDESPAAQPAQTPVKVDEPASGEEDDVFAEFARLADKK